MADELKGPDADKIREAVYRASDEVLGSWGSDDARDLVAYATGKALGYTGLDHVLRKLVGKHKSDFQRTVESELLLIQEELTKQRVDTEEVEKRFTLFARLQGEAGKHPATIPATKWLRTQRTQRTQKCGPICFTQPAPDPQGLGPGSRFCIATAPRPGSTRRRLGMAHIFGGSPAADQSAASCSAPGH